MSKISIPCLVQRDRKTSGISWYWQPSATLRAAGWEPVALGKDEGKAIVAARERNEAVANWKNGGAVDMATIRQRQQAGTMLALVERYRREVINGKKPNGKPILRQKTIDVYETSMKRIEAWAGKHPISYITPARIGVLRDKIARPVADGGIGHSAAFNMLCMIRQLFSFAESKDMMKRGSNPATDFNLGKPPARRSIWELEDDAAFDAAARELNMPGMALARELGLYTAQREGDLIRFTEPQLQQLEIMEPVLRERLVDDRGRIMGWCFNQTKTSNDYLQVQMEIPFEPGLLARVESVLRTNRARDRAANPPRLISYVLADDRGLPWKQRAFISCWTKILAHAADRTGREGMRDLVWHDLRRTRVVRLRRMGMAKEMIAALTGHSLRSIEEMLRVYGPVDPTITANAIVASLPPRPAKQTEEAKEVEA